MKFTAKISGFYPEVSAFMNKSADICFDDNDNDDDERDDVIIIIMIHK